MKNLIQPDNSAEAQALQSLLEQHGIQSQVISFHDTAYDGLFQKQYGWGVIRVAENDLARAEEIIQDWQSSSPDEVPWNDTPSDQD